MSNKLHLEFLLECAKDQDNGGLTWNNWRKDNDIQSVDLSKANLQKLILHRYNFAGADLNKANLSNSILIDSNFIKANLNDAILIDTDFREAHFIQASLTNANFSRAKLSFVRMVEVDCSNSSFAFANLTNALLINSNFTNANFRNAQLITANMAGAILQNSNLRECNLSGTNLTNADLSYADISKANIYGVSVWNVNTNGLIQEDLEIKNDQNEVLLTMDDIVIAQFLFLISHNANLARIIDKITSKVVLILGRFTPERKIILDELKNQLRLRGYVPVIFDFEKPKSRDLTETIGLIGRMAKFIVADLTDAKSIPQELSELIPNNPSLVIRPIILKGNLEYSMFEHWKNYPWVLDVYKYESIESLKNSITTVIIEPVERYLNGRK